MLNYEINPDTGNKVYNLMSAENLKLFISILKSMSGTDINGIEEYDSTKVYNSGSYVVYNDYLYRVDTSLTGEFDSTKATKIGNDLTTISEQEIIDMLNLTQEELDNLQNILDDSQIILDKTWSSSKIYSEIQSAIEQGEEFTLSKLASTMKSSYSIATSTDEMTESNILYLLSNGTSTYDIYALIDGTATLIGTTEIDLTDYLKTSDAESTYLKITDAQGTYATITNLDTLNTEVTNIKDEIGTETLETIEQTIKGAINEVNGKSTILTVTQSEYDSLVAGNTVTIDEKDYVYDSETYYIISDDTDNLDLNQFNIKTYTTLEQLGLADGCSVGDIYNALPDNSYFECGVSQTKNNNLYLIEDMPEQSSEDESYLLTIRKYNNYRFSIESKRSYNGSASKNLLWLGNLQGSDGTGLTWSRVCTTSIEDVDKAIITTQNLSAGIVSYFIKDGICYVSVSSITPSSDGGSTIGVANSLPIPNTKGINHYTLGTTSGNSGLFIINTDGSITFYGKNTLSYFGQFSYPVAE